ncbi:MAG TPA: hypothetical protein VFV18_08585 [Porticoccaceae bacterium]|nr:hypothetical protein [Porticoccaceae bacterium]
MSSFSPLLPIKSIADSKHCQRKHFQKKVTEKTFPAKNISRKKIISDKNVTDKNVTEKKHRRLAADGAFARALRWWSDQLAKAKPL